MATVKATVKTSSADENVLLLAPISAQSIEIYGWTDAAWTESSITVRRHARRQQFSGLRPVSYTHLTLPTNREV